jgi:hypothetical protein
MPTDRRGAELPHGEERARRNVEKHLAEMNGTPASAGGDDDKEL